MSVSCLLVACVGLLAGVTIDSPMDLQEAIYQEVVLGKTEEALRGYRKLLEDEKSPKEVQAQAFQRIAVCLAKQGKAGEADQALRALEHRFPGEIGLLERGRAEVGLYRVSPERQFGRSRFEELMLTLAAEGAGRATQAARMLTLLAPESIPHLKRALAHPDPTLRLRAAEVLFGLDDLSGYDVVRDAMLQGERSLGSLRYLSTEVLLSRMLKKKPDMEKEVKGLVALANDPDAKARLLQTLAHAETGGEEALELAESLLESPRYRQLAWRCLISGTPPERALKTATEMVTGEDPGPIGDVIYTYMRRLKSDPLLIPQGSDPLLRKALERKDSATLECVASNVADWIAGREGKGWPGGLSEETAFQVVAALLDSEDASVQGRAPKVLKKLVSLSTEEGWFQEIREPCVDLYLRMAEMSHHNCSHAGLQALIPLAEGDEALSERLLRWSVVRRVGFDRSDWGRRFIEEHPDLVEKILRDLLETAEHPGNLLDWILRPGSDIPGDFLEKYLDRWPSYGGNVAGKLQSLRNLSAIPYLLQILREGNRGARLSALNALGSYGAVDAVPDIIPMLGDLDEQVRGEARSALEEIRRLDEERDEWSAWYRARKEAEKE